MSTETTLGVPQVVNYGCLLIYVRNQNAIGVPHYFSFSQIQVKKVFFYSYLYDMCRESRF